MEPKTPQEIVCALALGSIALSFLVRRFRDKTPTWLALVVDVLPVVWMFFFAWSLVHHVSDLIPARKHGPREGSSAGFNKDAMTAAYLMAFVAALFPRRARGVGVGLLALLLAFIGTADILHMRIFGSVVSFGAHGSILQLWDARSSVVSLFESRDKWVLPYFVGAIALTALWRVKPLERKPLIVGAWLVTYVVPIAYLASVAIPPARADVTEFLGSKWAREVLNRSDQVWDAGFLEAHVRAISLDIKLAHEHKDPTPAELEQVDKIYKDEHAEHFTSNLPSFGQFKGKNLLVIQIEAFENWLVGAKVNGQEVTPSLNRLKQRGLFYPHIFNVVAASSTADCEYLFLNSNHPLPDGAVAFRRDNNHFVTLATTLRDAGYSTVSMHGYERGMWNRAVLHPRYGFTHSLFAEELGTTPKVGWGLDDHAFFPQVVTEIKKEKAPWFVYTITLSSHHPYNDIPLNRRRLKLGPLERTMLGDYLHSAAFADDAIGQFIDQLDAQGLLKDTVVVMYGDHDAHLKSPPRDRASLASISNLPKSVTDYVGAGSWYLSRIPLLILFPPSETPAPAGIAPAYGAQIDFAPTILHYLGIDPPRSFLGHPLLPGDVGGFVSKWDGSFVSPPLIFDAASDDCRVLADQRKLPTQTCRPLADKTRKKLEASWLVTNNDLARRLVAKAEPLSPPAPKAEAGVPLGGACHEEKECAGPTGYDAHCMGGLCVTDPKGPCEHPGATGPCGLGSGCLPLSSDLNVCAADCDTFACAGQCTDTGLCAPKP